ncbi:hypothetical protein D3C84_825490 [compost metagenome]
MLFHDGNRQQHHRHGGRHRVVQPGQAVRRHDLGVAEHHHDHQHHREDVHVPGDAVRVLRTGDAGVAAGQCQARADAGHAAHGAQGVEVGHVRTDQVGDDRQQGAAQRQGATRSAAHEGRHQQGGEHGEAELGRHQQPGLGFVEFEVVDDRADQKR